MNGSFRKRALQSAVSLALIGGFGSSHAVVNVQCPGDTNGDAVIDTPDPAHPDAKCMHLTAGDGFAVMSDGKEIYTFGFADATGTPRNQVIAGGILLGVIGAVQEMHCDAVRYLPGALIVVVQRHDVHFGTGFWAFAGVMLCLAAAVAGIDREELWDRLEVAGK